MNEQDMQELLKEFGFLAEEAHDVEQSVKDQIARAAGKDEVDTIAFGLETDDGQIVKVYVNAEHAEKFETEMAKMLGEVDDIEEALNQISKDIEVVDVEWPDDEESEEGDDAEDVDPEATADESDGSEVMNSKVYSKENKKKEQANEELTYGEELTQSLLEGQHSISNQLSTVNQHLVYQAILHLGVPELALDRSPYRSAILRGIKDTAMEMAHTPSMRTTLKSFIKHQAEEDRDEKQPRKELFKHEPKEPKVEPKVEPKTPKLHDEPVKHGKLHDKPHAALMKHEPAEHKPVKSVKEAVEPDETAVESYWAAVDTIINLLDSSATKLQAQHVTNSQAYKSLVARSSSQVVGKLTAGIRSRLKNLATVTAEKGEVVTEQLTVVEVEALLSKLLKLADSKGLNAERVIGSQAFKRLMISGKAAVQALSSSVKRALSALKVELDKVVEAEELSFDEKPEPKSSAEAPADQDTPEEPPVEEPAKAPTAPAAADASESGVSFAAEGDALTVSYPQGKFELAGESLERAMKALTNKQTLSVQTVGGKFVVFSPRGSSAVIKLMGTDAKVSLEPPDISAFLDAAGQVAAGDEKASKEETKEA